MFRKSAHRTVFKDVLQVVAQILLNSKCLNE